MRPGDEVVCDLWRHKASGALLAKGVKVVRLAEGLREQGVVSSLKTDKEGGRFGFVRCCSRCLSLSSAPRCLTFSRMPSLS